MFMVMSQDMMKTLELTGSEIEARQNPVVNDHWSVCFWNSMNGTCVMFATYNTKKEAKEALLLMCTTFEHGNRTFRLRSEVIGGRNGDN